MAAGFERAFLIHITRKSPIALDSTLHEIAVRGYIRNCWLLVILFGFVFCPVAGLFGEALDDVTTDRIFEDMGQADVVKFEITDGIVTFTVTLEDRQGQDEIWIVDFQPFVFNGESPIDGNTGFLYSDGTGSCSNIEQSHPMSEGYFGDNFFQSFNSTGAKALFKVYQRGDSYDANGTRVDVISFEGSMGTLLDCTMSDGTPAWQQSLTTYEVVYNTVMYVTNVRPIEGADTDNEAVDLVAYVQSNIELVWTIARRAILNFVIASQSIYKPKMIILVGRVIVEFDFAIIEPYLLADGSIDPSRIHLEMGISTYTPKKNTSLLVFYDKDSIEYISEDPGNKLIEILKWPPTNLLDSPGCIFTRADYCRQMWEFEFILEMSLESLSEDDPLDAGGDFRFQYESFLCEDYLPSIECLPHDLPLWNVTADLTLQTIIDVVDEDLDVVKVSVVRVVNDNGEDLRGGSGVKHMENVTMEVTFSPAFLRDRFNLDLSLFMVCMGEDSAVSSRGCLSTEESERYTAFLSEDFELDYDPLQDPLYQQSLISTTTVATVAYNLPTTETIAVETVCEGGDMVLTCPYGEVIKVHDAVYGRKSTSVCPGEQSSSTTSCEAYGSLSMVRDRCKAMASCTVPASNDIFGEPCQGVAKYLQVDYTCESEWTHWTDPVFACIRGNNAESHNNVDTIEGCRQLCIDATGFLCLSLDYNAADKSCLLSEVNSDTVNPPSDYTEPCDVDPGNTQYAERRKEKRQWTNPVFACIRANNAASYANVETVRDCRQLCVDATGFLCLSFDYNIVDRTCLLSEVNSDTVDPPSDYTKPCYVDPDDIQYAERHGVLEWIYWTEPVQACIRGNNAASHTRVDTVAECHHLCVNAAGFECLSFDYNIGDRTCLLSDVSSDTVVPPSDYTEPCYVDPDDVLYSERRTGVPTSTVAMIAYESSTVSTRFVSRDVTVRFSLLEDQSTGSIFLLPANSAPAPGSVVLTDDVFLQVYRFPPESTNDEYAIFKVGSLPAAIISKQNGTDFSLASDQLELYQNIFDAMPSESSGTELKSLLFSAYFSLPNGNLTYIGFEDPADLPCSQFSLAVKDLEFAELTLSPYTPGVDAASLQFLGDAKTLYATLIALRESAREYQETSLTAADFMMGPEWNGARPATEAVAGLTAVLSQLMLETIWGSAEGSLIPIQNLLKSFILTKPLPTSEIIGDDLHNVLGRLQSWVEQRPAGMSFESLMATVIRTALEDPVAHQNQILPLHEIFRPTLGVLRANYPGEDIEETFPELVSGDLGADWTFYDLLLNLTMGYNGLDDGIYYVSESAGRKHTSMGLAGNGIGYKVMTCEIPWDYYSNIWVYRESKVVSGETLAGGWDHWADWSSCSVPCAGGVKTRTRVCLDDTSPCTWSGTEVMACNELPCGRFKNEDGLVQSISPSELAMTYDEVEDYCIKERAALVGHPGGAARDSYLQLRIKSENIGDVWVDTSSPGDCKILRSNGLVSSVPCTDHYRGLCISDFVRFAEAFAHNGQKLGDTLFYQDTRSGPGDMGPPHYIDLDLREAWNKDIAVDKVRLEVFDNDMLVVDFLFDAIGTEPTNWFQSQFLESSWPYQDILAAGGQRTHFKIYYKHSSQSPNRNVLVAERRIGVCSKRTGWLIIVDGAANSQCNWQESPTYPLILYSKLSGVAKWQSSDVGEATRMVVSLRYYSHEGPVTLPPPQATTPPLPVAYSADMVPPPEDWQTLNYQGYDEDRQVHTSEFTNLALSGDTAVYTMTAVYSISEKSGQLRKRRKRSLVESIQYPKVRSLPYRFLGCPKNSTHNQDRLSCECESPGFQFSRSSLACEREVPLLELPGPTEATVPSTPTSTGTSQHRTLVSLYLLAAVLATSYLAGSDL